VKASRKKKKRGIASLVMLFFFFFGRSFVRRIPTQAYHVRDEEIKQARWQKSVTGERHEGRDKESDKKLLQMSLHHLTESVRVRKAREGKRAAAE
jgi:hypothetical protein